MEKDGRFNHSLFSGLPITTTSKLRRRSSGASVCESLCWVVYTVSSVPQWLICQAPPTVLRHSASRRRERYAQARRVSECGDSGGAQGTEADSLFRSRPGKSLRCLRQLDQQARVFYILEGSVKLLQCLDALLKGDAIRNPHGHGVEPGR